MSFTTEEFEAGIKYWRTKQNWQQDFHNELYKNLYGSENRNKFNIEWWNNMLPLLVHWVATRPKTNEYLKNRFIEKSNEIKQIWTEDIFQLEDKTIEIVEWNQIKRFTEIISEIKNVKSPVFTSKLCHFIEPRIFPVTDNAAMGLPYKTYKEYYLKVQEEWIETNMEIKEKLINKMTGLIGLNIIERYPFRCKIIDSCLIGRNNI